MITVTVTSNAADTHGFLVEFRGSLAKRKSLNDALGKRLAKELQSHFLARNSGPNRMAAPKTGFWGDVAGATALAEVTDTGATVSIGDVRFRIQLYGGTIKPTGGRRRRLRTNGRWTDWPARFPRIMAIGSRKQS